MSDFVDMIQVLTPLLLLVLAFFTGRALERAHYARIRRREKETLRTPAITVERTEEGREVQSAALAVGSVVVSVDYFKRFLGVFRNLFGGEMAAYSSVIDRGRREAILRMKESYPQADVFLNCRLETATILNRQGKTSGCVEVVAYGTAISFVRKLPER